MDWQQLYDRHQPPPTRSPSPRVYSESDFIKFKRDRARAARNYAMQVRSFVEAAEVIDVDPDTIKDILDGFDGVVNLEDIEDDDDEAEASMKPDDEQGYLSDDTEDLELEHEYLEEGKRCNTFCGFGDVL